MNGACGVNDIGGARPTQLQDCDTDAIDDIYEDWSSEGDEEETETEEEDCYELWAVTYYYIDGVYSHMTWDYMIASYCIPQV